MRTLVSHGDGVWSTREEDEVLGEGEGTRFAGSWGDVSRAWGEGGGRRFTLTGG